MDQRPVLVIGSSSALVFRGVETIFPTPCLTPGIDVLQCADSTAYGLGGRDTKFIRLIEKAFHKREHCAIAFAFGALDCRTHIVRNARLLGVEPTEMARVVAAKYLAAILHARRFGDAPVIFVCPPASTPVEVHPTWKIDGTVFERNAVVKAFRDRLAEEPTVRVIDTLDFSTNSDGSSNPDAFYDRVHLKVSCLPIILDRLRVALRELGVEWAEQGGGDFNIACKESATDKVITRQIVAPAEALSEPNRPPLARSA